MANYEFAIEEQLSKYAVYLQGQVEITGRLPLIA